MIQNLRKIFTLLLLTPYLLVAQDSTFNNFKTTLSSGEPPAIFVTSFKDKIAAKIESKSNLGEDDIENFALYTNYALNNLLQSGSVLYGDPMTQFVQKIADKLLENDAKLKSELQFYVIKTNITNALCTDPGVIFITTGLISQIENEAQLAYIIAHEIVHYQEKHLEESYSKSKENDLDPNSSYEDLVLLSKDHEFEADKNALKIYHSAGYSHKEINTVFDVLMYSYLSFDEINIDQSFFGNPNIYVPESLFPENANPILAFEDYDDRKSTHPNIRKRKDAIAKEIDKYQDWKNNTNYISLEEFNHVQNISRLESVRGNLITANYVKALYEIYILEKIIPNNEYLQTSKAFAWNAMSQTSISGKKRTFLNNLDEKEGAISMLYGFLNNLSREEMALMAVRQAEDAYLKFPSSTQLKSIRNQTISNLAHLRNFEIKTLEKISFNAAIDLRENNDKDSIISDTLEIEEETKYDRIRRIREQQSSSGSTAELIDENFSTFLLFDLASNREFYELYEKEQEDLKLQKENKLSSKSKKERKEIVKIEEQKLKESDIILITPHLEASKKGRFDLEQTLTFYEIMTEEVLKYAPKDRLHNKDIALGENFTTKKHNESSLINSFLIQISNLENSKFGTLIFDYEEFDQLFANYKNPYLLLITGKANKSSSLSNSLSGQAQYIEVSTGEVSGSGYYSVPMKIRKESVGGLAFEIFSKFNLK
ncbi:M48 family metallopeptidase [Brumimicrobium mesophilum]|uniref:M48 family metallopeptidase n=1 Tax=Brumimicrobium mesophilum TaxID=392717 RepID=UPI001F1EB19F|nr:M48 family metallopeptidase [Brumimicrobium mesophilum]